MTPVSRRASLLVMLLGFLTTMCSGKGESSPEVPDLSAFRLIGQMDGWREVEDSYVAFDATNFFSLINGGAQVHVDNGLVQGFVQLLQSDGDRHLEVYVEKFDLGAGAAAVFDLQASGLGETLALPAFGVSTAMAGRILGGVVVYAHMDRFYFSLTLTGYDPNEAGVDAVLLADVEGFLGFYDGLLSPGN